MISTILIKFVLSGIIMYLTYQIGYKIGFKRASDTVTRLINTALEFQGFRIIKGVPFLGGCSADEVKQFTEIWNRRIREELLTKSKDGGE